MKRMRGSRKQFQQVSSSNLAFLTDFIFFNPNKGEKSCLFFLLHSMTCRKFLLWSHSNLSHFLFKSWSHRAEKDHLLHTLFYREEKRFSQGPPTS